MRILIVRLSAVGDIIHALPLAENASRAGAEVGWVVEQAYAGLLEGNPAIARLFPADTRSWRRSPLSARSRSEIRRLKISLRGFQADATIDAQGLWKSALLARLAGAPVVSLGARDRRERTSSVLVDRPVALGQGMPHVVDQNLSLLAALDRRRGAGARRAVPSRRTAGGGGSVRGGASRPFALFHPGTSRAGDHKAWGRGVLLRRRSRAAFGKRLASFPRSPGARATRTR